MLNKIKSITEIKPEDCYQTNGSRPVKVLCSDLNYYICKYFAGVGFASSLFNEYLAASFLKLWNLQVPDFAIVEIDSQHIVQTSLPKQYFNKPCFGSLYHGNYPEVDKFMIDNKCLKKDNKTALYSFLKIGIFDIWMCNEDRNFNNFNMLYNQKENVFVPIDHVFSFNGNNLDREHYPISDNESIIDSPFLSGFFSRNLQQLKLDIRLEILNDFNFCVKLCNEQLENIINSTPLEWNPQPEYLRQRLQFLFSKDWTKQCENQFNRIFVLKTK
ncbi:MAG: hypothetical protein JXR36_04460 [Bacteroidales bacterium]|nr:hypothetical protein [Bacteroidales bacterium]